MGFNYSSKLYGAGGATIGDNGFVYNPVTDTLTVGTLNANNVTATALATPGAITVTNQGTPGGTTVTYKLVALLADGTTTEAGAASSTATSNATLSATNFNRLTWSAVTGAASYRVYRTVAPTSPATTGIVYAGTALTVDDKALAGGGEVAPTVNTTGMLTATRISAGSADLVSSGSGTTFKLSLNTADIFYRAATDNLAIGTTALQYVSQPGNIGIGYYALANATTGYNIGIGAAALQTNSGANSVGIGYSAGAANSGAKLTAVGYSAGYGNQGASNSLLGYEAGHSPGGVTANANTTGAQNTWIGQETGSDSTSQRSNSAALGYRALVSASNQVVLGNASVTEVQLGTGGVAQGTAASYLILGANGEQAKRGYSTELVTLSTSGTTTDTSANLLPANAIIESVVARVTTTITTATDWKLGDATTPGRFTAANSTMTAGTTDVGLVHVDQAGAAGPRQTTAAKVRITTTGTPGAGVVRVTVFWRQYVPGTT